MIHVHAYMHIHTIDHTSYWIPSCAYTHINEEKYMYTHTHYILGLLLDCQWHKGERES